MDGWVGGRVDVWVDEWIDELVGGGWLDGWIDWRVDEWGERVAWMGSCLLAESEGAALLLGLLRQPFTILQALFGP